MALHHILIDSYSSLLSHGCPQDPSNQAQNVSKDLYQAVSSILRDAKCDRFTLHIFNSTLPSPPRCETEHVNPRTLGNIRNEIMTNLQLTNVDPVQTPDDSSMSGITKVVLKLLRKVSNDRVMHSANPMKHTIYLFSCVPERYEEQFTVEKVIHADAKNRGNPVEPTNSLHEAFSRLGDCHARLVWVNLGARKEEFWTQQTRQTDVGSKSPDTRDPESCLVRIKNIHSFLHREPPRKQLLASSLQKRLDSVRSEICQSEGSRLHAQIVFQPPGEYPAKLKLLASVTIRSLQSSSKGNQTMNMLFLSHYLKDSEPYLSQNTLSAKKYHPRTMRPRSGHDVSSFSSFLRYLKQMNTLAVAEEISVDHKQRKISCCSVLIVPYSANVATVHKLPEHHSCHTPPQDSNFPNTYEQWVNWYDGGGAIQTDSDVKSKRGSSTLNESALFSSALGLKNRTVPAAPGKIKSAQKPSNRVESECHPNSTKLSAERIDEHDAPVVVHESVDVKPGVKRKSTKPSHTIVKPAKRSPGPALASARITDTGSTLYRARRVSAITKTGFRYKRVTAKSLVQDIADNAASIERFREVSGIEHRLDTVVDRNQKHADDSTPAGNDEEMDMMQSRDQQPDQLSIPRISDLGRVSPRTMPTHTSIKRELPKPDIRQIYLESDECIEKELPRPRVKRKHETREFPKGIGADVVDTCETLVEHSDSPFHTEQKQVEEKPSKVNSVPTLQEQPNDNAVRSLRNEETPIPASWQEALHQLVQKFEAILVHLSDCSEKKPIALVQEAMRSLSEIALAVSQHSRDWRSLSSIATRRLKSHEAVIDSIQSAQKYYYSNEKEQAKVSAVLWKVMIEALEQVMWLVSKVLDPDSRTSKKRKKPETVNRATTILSCVQVMGQLTSSYFDSPELFDIVFESFFGSILVHLAQTSLNKELNYWARDVFEHFEKEISSSTRAQRTDRGALPSDHGNGKARDSNFPNSKTPYRSNQQRRKRKTQTFPNHTARGRIKRVHSQISVGRKPLTKKPESLKYHPAFRRGQAFTGHTRKKKSVQKKTPIPSSTYALDRLVHTGSLQSSLDAIKLPESSDDDLDGDQIAASDNEGMRLVNRMASNSKRHSKQNPPMSSAVTSEDHAALNEDACFRGTGLRSNDDRNAEMIRNRRKSNAPRRDDEVRRDKKEWKQKTHESPTVMLRSSRSKESVKKSIQHVEHATCSI